MEVLLNDDEPSRTVLGRSPILPELVLKAATCPSSDRRTVDGQGSPGGVVPARAELPDAETMQS